MTKPTGVQVSAALMALFIVLDIAVAFLAPRGAIVPGSRMDNPAFAFMVHGGGSLIFGLISAIFVYFYWAGKNWARWVIIVVSALCILGLLAITYTWAKSPMSGMLSLAKAALAAFLLYYLNTKPVAAWFEGKAPATLA